jgi:hypothetical protein
MLAYITEINPPEQDTRCHTLRAGMKFYAVLVLRPATIIANLA